MPQQEHKYKVNLNGSITRLGLTSSVPPPNNDSRLNRYSVRAIGRLRDACFALQAYAMENKQISSMLTLTMDDSYSYDDRFEYRRKFMKAFQRWYNRKFDGVYHYVYTTELTLRAKVHFHVCIVHKYGRMTDFIAGWNKRNKRASVNIQYNRKVWYITKYLTKFPSLKMGKNDYIKAMLKANMTSKYRLWYSNIPFDRSTTVHELPFEAVTKRIIIDGPEGKFQKDIMFAKNKNDVYKLLKK